MTEKLKVLTWLWHQPDGRAAYAPWHVRVWAEMMRRHLTLPHTLAVVTDLDGDFGEDVEVIQPTNEFLDVRLPRWGNGRPQCLRRLSMFRRDAADLFGADRIVCTDLDLIVSRSIDPVLSIKDDFRICRGTAPGRFYNGSMMSIKLGAVPQVYESFTAAGAIEAGSKFVGSDQAWISHKLGPNVPTWGPEHGIEYRNGLRGREKCRAMFFPGEIKPWHLVDAGDLYAMEHYRGFRRGDRCLVLGYAPSVWDELVALDTHYDEVIASPETAQYWTGPLLAIANDDEHADRLVAMHGFSESVFCGRSGGIADVPMV